MRLYGVICFSLVCCASFGFDFLYQSTANIGAALGNVAYAKQALNVITGDGQRSRGARRAYNGNYNNGAFYEDANYQYINKNKANHHQQNKKNRPKERKIPIDVLLPNNTVVKISIDSQANRLAIARSNGTVDIANMRGNGYVKTIQAEMFGGIRSMHFVGDNHILYTCVDHQHNKHLMAINFQGKSYREITPINNCKHVHVYGEASNALVLSSDGRKSYIHEVNFKGNDLNLSELFEVNNYISKIIPSSKSKSFVYTVEKNNVINCMLYKRNAKHELIEHELIDTINAGGKYISFSNDSTIYKVVNGQLCSIDLKKNSRFICNISNIENCSMQLDAEGKLIFITRKKEDNTHISIKKSFIVGNKEINTGNLLNILNNAFNGYNWERVDSSSDGRYWLLKITHPLEYTKYIILDICNFNNRRVVCVDGRRYSNIPAYGVAAVRIPVSSQKSISGFVTFPRNYQKDTPVMVFLRRSNSSYFSKQFDFISQFLADRGYLVICVNQDCNAKNFETANELNNILNWLGRGSQKYRIYATDLSRVMLVSLCKDTSKIFNELEKNDSLLQKLACMCFINPMSKIDQSVNVPSLFLLLNAPISNFKHVLNDDNVSIFSITSDNAVLAALLTRFMCQSVDNPWFTEKVNLNEVHVHSDGRQVM